MKDGLALVVGRVSSLGIEILCELSTCLIAVSVVRQMSWMTW